MLLFTPSASLINVHTKHRCRHCGRDIWRKFKQKATRYDGIVFFNMSDSEVNRFNDEFCHHHLPENCALAMTITDTHQAHSNQKGSQSRLHFSSGNQSLAASQTWTRLASTSLPELSAAISDELCQVPFYLNDYRRRIDAGVLEQRRQREILEGLQDKVLNYRLKSARQRCNHSTVASLNYKHFSASDLSSDSDQNYAHHHKKQVRNHFCSFDELPLRQVNLTNTSESASDLFTAYGDYCHGSNNLPSTSTAAPSNVAYSMQHIAFTETPQKCYGSDDESLLDERLHRKRPKRGGNGRRMYVQHKNDLQTGASWARRRRRNHRLEIERMEANHLRNELNRERADNDLLSAEIKRLTDALRHLSLVDQHNTQQIVDDYHRHNKALCQRLSEFRIEFLAVKRRLTDLAADVRTDFQAQKTDFHRAFTMVSRLVDRTHTMLNTERHNVSQQINETLSDVLQKYDAALVKNAEMELKQANRERDCRRLESSLHAVDDERNSLKAFLRQIWTLLPSRCGGERAEPLENDELSTLDFTSPSVQDTLLRRLNAAVQSMDAMVSALHHAAETEKEKRMAVESRFSTLEMELNDAQRSSRINSEEKKQIEKEKTELDEKCSKLREQRSALETEKSIIERTLSTLRIEYEQLHNKHTSALSEMETRHMLRCDEMRNEWMAKCADADAKLERFRDAQTRHEAPIIADNKRLTVELMAERQALERLNVQLYEENAQSQLAKCKWDEECCRLNDQLLKLRSELDAKLTELRDHKNSAAILEKKLRSEISRLSTQWEENLKKIVREADQRVNVERTVKEEVINELDRLKVEVGLVNEKLTKQNISKEKLKSALSNLRDERSAFKERLKVAERKVDDKELSLQRHVKERKDFLQELELLRANLVKEQERYGTLTVELEDVKGRLLIAQSNAERFQQDNYDKSVQLKELAVELDLVRERLIRAEQSLREKSKMSLEMTVTGLLDVHKRVGVAERDEKSLIGNLMSEQELISLRAQRVDAEALSSENARLRDQLTELTKELQEEQNTHEMQLAKLRADFTESGQLYAKQLAEMTIAGERQEADRRDLIAAMERDANASERRADEAARQATELRERLADAESRIERGAEMIKRLYADMEEMSEQSESQSHAAERQLDELNRRLTKVEVELTESRHEFEQKAKECLMLEERLAIMDSKAEISTRQFEMQLKSAVEKERTQMTEELRVTTSQLQKRINVLEKGREELRRQLDTAEAHVTFNTKSFVAEREDIQLQLTQALTEAKTQRQLLSTYEAQIRQKSVDFAEAFAQKERTELQLSDNVAELDALRAELLLAKHNSQPEENDEIGSLRNRLKATQEALRGKEQERRDAYRRLRLGDTEIASLKNRVETLLESRRDIALKLRASRRRVNALGSELATVERSARDVLTFASARGWTINYSGDVTTLPVRHLSVALRNDSSEKLHPDDEMKELFAAELPVSVSSSTSARRADTNEGSSTVSQMVHCRDNNIYAGQCPLSDEADDEAEPERIVHHRNQKDNNEDEKKRSRSVFSIVSTTMSSDLYGIDLVGSSSGGSGVANNSDTNNTTQKNARTFPLNLPPLSTEACSRNNPLSYRRRGASVENCQKWRCQTKMLSMSNLATASPQLQIGSDSMSLPALESVSASNKNLTSLVELSFIILRQRIIDLEIRYFNKRREMCRTRKRLTEVELGRDHLSALLKETRERARQTQEQLESLKSEYEKERKNICDQLKEKHEAERSNLNTELLMVKTQLTEVNMRLTVLQSEIKHKTDELLRVSAEEKHLKETMTDWQAERDASLKKQRGISDSLKQMREKCDVLVAEKQVVDRLEEMKTSLAACETREVAWRRRVDALQSDVARLQATATRTSPPNAERSAQRRAQATEARCAADLRQRLDTTRQSLDEMTAKWRDAKQDCEQTRRDMLDVRTRLNTTVVRLNNVQATLTDTNAERHRLAGRLEVLEKLERESAAAEQDARRELEQLLAERLKLVAENEELRRGAQSAEISLRELNIQLDKARRELDTRHIVVETLETEKRHVETVTRRTAAERQALERSLSVMERENAQLQRQCVQLQAQLNRLDRSEDSGSVGTYSFPADGRRRIHQLEAELHRLNQSKRQLEKTISQREQNQAQRERVHEAQLSALREQLDRERQRQRQQRQTAASSGAACALRTVTTMERSASTSATMTLSRKTLRTGGDSNEQSPLQLSVYGSRVATSTRPPSLPSSSHSYYDHQNTVFTSLSTTMVEEQPANNATNEMVITVARCSDQAGNVSKGVNKPANDSSSMNNSTRI